MAKLALSEAKVTAADDDGGTLYSKVSVLVHGTLFRLTDMGQTVFQADGAWQVYRVGNRHWTVSDGVTSFDVLGTRTSCCGGR